MPLQPQFTSVCNGLLVNNLILTPPEQKPAAINLIKVYQLPELTFGAFTTTQAEFMSRQCVYENFERFNWFIDNWTAWNLGNDSKEIKVGLCGKNESARRNLKKILIYLCRTYNLGLNQIYLSFSDPQLFKELGKFIEAKEIPKSQLFTDVLDIPKQTFIPKVTYEVYTMGQWQQSTNESQIEAIKIHATGGKLTYRVFSKNCWFPWVKDGEQSGSFTYPIKGFQYIYDSDDYELWYRCTLINGEVKDWRNTSLKIPYKKIITGLEFKLEKK